MASTPKQPRNILLLTSDQQHWFTLGVQNPEVKTPNLDRLAARGMRFDRAYTVNPTCTPTRASIITGLYPSQHGAWSLGTKLPEEVPTVGDCLAAYGYRTALVGKAHFQQLYDHPQYRSIESNPLQQNLAFWRQFDQPFYGFQQAELARNHGYEFHVGQHYALWLEEKGFKNWRDCFLAPGGNRRPGEIGRTWNIPEEFHYDAWIAERVNTLLEGYHARGERFFLWGSFLDPHPPYVVPEPWDRMYDPEKITLPEPLGDEFATMPPHFAKTQEANPDYSMYDEPDGHNCHGFHSHRVDRKALARDVAVYYGMISLMDKYIGRILDKLDELGLTDDTLVVFSTDHGHYYGHHGLVAKGAFHYEDAIRVPFLASLPGSIPAGGVSQSLQSLVDLAPTFLDYAGIPVPRAMTGVSQRPTWDGGGPSREHVIVENRHQPTTIHMKTWIDARYKLTVYYNRPYGELFDLQADPHERVNLWDRPDCQALRGELLLKFLHAEMGKEPLWMPRVWGA